MTLEELQFAFEKLRAEGYSEEQLLQISYKMYADGKIDIDTLETVCAILGYEFTDEFKNMSDEDKKKQADPPKELLEACGLTLQEAKSIVAQLREQYGGKAETAWALNRLFVENEISSNELTLYCHILGYTFTEEFKNMTEEEKKEYCLQSLEGNDEKDAPLDITEDEAKEEIATFREQGMTDEEILDICQSMHQKGDISFESLSLMADFLGYEIK